MELDLERMSELQVAVVDRESLADPRACVVEEQEKAMVARFVGCPSIGLPQHQLHFLRLKIGDDGRRGPLVGQGEDPLILRATGRVLPHEVAKEGANHGEPQVSCGHGVVTTRLKMLEEVEDLLDSEILQAQVSDCSSACVGHEGEKQPQGVAIGEHGVPAGISNSSQVVAEKRLNQDEQRVWTAVGHVGLRRRPQADPLAADRKIHSSWPC